MLTQCTIDIIIGSYFNLNFFFERQTQIPEASKADGNCSKGKR